VTGQNQLPTWFGLALRVGGVVVAVVLGFAALQGSVNALDTRVDTIEQSTEKHEEQLHLIRETQIRVVVTLEQIRKDIAEIKVNLKEHDDNGN